MTDDTPTFSTREEIFPWEKDFDLDRLAEEYAEINGWDLEKCRQEIYRSMIQVARDLEPGRWISSEMTKLADE